MFDRLQDKLMGALKKMARQGQLTEADVNNGMREIRLALLEADVNLAVVKDFVQRVKARAMGADILTSLSPAEQLTKIVYDELVAMLGGADYDPKFEPGTGRYVVMMVGLQGSGKTTTAAKLANRFKSEGRRPLLVAADLSRPAAVDQLQVLGRQIHVDVHAAEDPTGADPVAVATAGVESAAHGNLTPVIVDTAGRLAIDEDLMQELEEVKARIKPDEILLVLDALTGQDAVDTAQRFNERLELSGLVLTKLDGDARGGAALSMRAITGKPVRLMGTGEKVDALEYFHPERMASRILGYGDLQSLLEKAATSIDEEEAERLEKKLRKQKKFDLEDFMAAMRQTKKMGSMRQIINMLPGVKVSEEQLEQGQAELKKFEAIVNSMTRIERRDPRLLNGSRRRRIATGSGTSVQDINRFMDQFKQMQRLTTGMLQQTAMGGEPGQAAMAKPKRSTKATKRKKTKRKKRR
jgi:signal recognition particle subunit SRP54